MPDEIGDAQAGISGAPNFFNRFFVPGTGFQADAPAPEIVAAQIVQGLIMVLGVIFALLMVYGGYLCMTSRGNEEQIKKAQGILRTVVVGFIIIAAAYAITSYVVDKLVERAFN